MTLIADPIARGEMLVRRPVDEVFEAFIDPRVTSHFWFSRGTDRLVAGKRLTWYWDATGNDALSQVRDLLGHASITTTERYDNQTLENLQAAVLKLESGKSFDPIETTTTAGARARPWPHSAR